MFDNQIDQQIKPGDTDCIQAIPDATDSTADKPKVNASKPSKTKFSDMIMWIVGLPLLLGSIPFALERGLWILVPILVLSALFDGLIIFLYIKELLGKDD